MGSWRVTLRLRETGEERRFLWNGHDLDARLAEWQWTNGNYSCDCNRAPLFFREDEHPEVEGWECGETMFEFVGIEAMRVGVIYPTEPLK